MMRRGFLQHAAVRWVGGMLLFTALLGFAHYKPWRHTAGPARETLVVGFLPVTCHLTCPVTDYATRHGSGTHFKSQLFLDFPSVAELDGSGRVLYYAKDIWPRFISCVLAANEKLIRERPAVVRKLVRGIAQSGAWAETHREQAAHIVAPFFRQDESLLRFVLTHPRDRISYRYMTPDPDDLAQIRDMALQTGILTQRIDIGALVDRSFLPADTTPASIPADPAAVQK